MNGIFRHLRARRLHVHRRNLDMLQFQAAQYGLAVPLALMNAIAYEEQAIVDLEGRLTNEAPAAGTPAVAPPLAANSTPHRQREHPARLQPLPVLMAVVVVTVVIVVFGTREPCESEVCGPLGAFSIPGRPDAPVRLHVEPDEASPAVETITTATPAEVIAVARRGADEVWWQVTTARGGGWYRADKRPALGPDRE